ncbi:MAG: peptidylprolyl isomerase [Spirochaetaceae bacterium]|nr:peptidylprolyl isomerase [Spirochaetaceae bacterium]
MKKYLFLIVIFMIPAFVFSQEIIDQRAASVNLIRPEIISQRQLDQTVEILRQNGIVRTRMEVLETMVGDVLLKQGAERARITVADSEIMNSARRQLGDAGARMTDQQVREIVSRETGVPWERYLERTRETIQLQRYVQRVKGANFANVPAPTNAEIRRFYDENTRQFLLPRTVRFDHIFIDMRALPTRADHDMARERATSYERDLRNGSRTFDELVINSDDTSSKYNRGNFGFLRVDDAQRRRILGDDFFDAVFAMQTAQISGIIRSNLGFHIIRMNEVIEPRILGLDDIISPEVEITVRDRIIDFLSARRQEEIFRQSVEELVAELTEEAEIRYFI